MGDDAASSRPYWGGLDGVRALALAAVLLFHSGFGWARGGFLGVSLFFTLSGFLITTILVGERTRDGSVSVPGFWSRRARRLLPASLVALGLAVVTTVAVLPDDSGGVALRDIQAAALQVVNWRFIAQGAAYADAGTLPSPVQHFWSLSVEEQFYIFFPIVALLAMWRRPKVLGIVLALVVAASTAQQLLLDDPTRVYFGTDTRIAEIALGGLLALARPRLVDAWRTAPSWLPDAAGLVGLLATAVLWDRVGLGSPGLYDGGFTAIAVVSLLVLVGAVDGVRVRTALGWRPLAYVGQVSYGAYLYHFPLFLIIAAPRVDLPVAPLFALRVAATMGLAIASYHLLERPIRNGTRLRGHRSTLVFVTGLAGLLFVTTVGVLHYGIPATSGVAALDVAKAPTVTTDPGATPPPHVLIVGDSTAAVLAEGLQEWGADTGRLVVSSVTSSGCATYPGERFRIRNGYEFVPKGCESLFTGAAAQAEADDVDAIVVLVGSSQLADWRYPGDDTWHDLEEPAIQAAYATALDTGLTTLEQAGVPVLWADVAVPAWDVDAFADLIGSGTPPGSGPVTMNDPDRTELLNRLTEAGMAAHPLAATFPWAEHLAGPDGKIPAAARSDGLHVAADKVPGLADAWLLDLLDATYDQVVARAPAVLKPASSRAWASDGATPAPTVTAPE